MDKLKVSISNMQKEVKIPTGIRLLIRKCCHAVLQMEELHGTYEVSVSFVSDEQMQELNRDYRGKDTSTDVLSFPSKSGADSFEQNQENNALMLGDIAICVPKVYSQAKQFGHSIQREFAYLTVHSALHLLGYDHECGGLDTVRMREKEEAVLARLGLQRDASYVTDYVMKPNRRSRTRYSLFSSFGWAVSGILHALRYERNLRIHFSVAAFVLYFSRYYDFSRLEYCVLILFIGIVITCEMLNTAIENTVDLETSDYNGLAKTAKDVAAGAVLVSSVASVAAGVLLFWDREILGVIWLDVQQNPVVWLLVIAVTTLWIILPRQKPTGFLSRRHK